MLAEIDRRLFSMRQFVATVVERGYCEKVADTSDKKHKPVAEGKSYEAFWLKVKKTGKIFPVLSSNLDKKLNKTTIGGLCEQFDIPIDEFDYVMKHLIEPPADN